jgi:hypothetical protein
MAVAIIGGLIVSTALSLVVVPSFFVVADRTKRRAGAWLRAARGGDAGDEAAGA